MKRRPILAACVLPWSIVIAALWSAQAAKADPVTNYTRIEAGVICNALTENPTLTTVSTLFRVIAKDAGFTVEDAAKVITGSVAIYCPGNQYVLDRFIAVYAPPPVFKSGYVGRMGGALR